MEPLPPRNTVPKDGVGPRGWPDCYYTSRTLDSTARYGRFIKKLRSLEEEQRRGALNKEKERKDQQYNDFFIRCDRRSLINNVARRVDLCLTSYQEDLKAKRQRLIDLLTYEEEMNIRKFVEQAQAGAQALWQDKKERLAYLLAKRKKEHDEKYREVPLSKCVHAHPCIMKMRSNEVDMVQRYQIKEKQAKKMAEIELDKMWHEVALKESEALAARMEMDAIERLRRDHDCIKHSDEQIAQRKAQRLREQEMLKQETLRMKEQFEQSQRKEDEESLQMKEKRLQTARDRKEMIAERRETLQRQAAEERLINNTWDSLAGMGLADDKAHEERRRQIKRELDVCNKKLASLKQDKHVTDAADQQHMEREARQQQDNIDRKRCAYLQWSKKNSDEVHAGVRQQIKDNAARRAQAAGVDAEELEYQRQLDKQLDQLVAQRQLTEAQARKLYQSQLREQINYTQLLKEREKQEEIEQRKKYQNATDDYQFQINKILSRLVFSDQVHPFLKRIHNGVATPEKCPCSKPDYCAVPIIGPKAGTSAAVALKAGPTAVTKAVPETSHKDATGKVAKPRPGATAAK